MEIQINNIQKGDCFASLFQHIKLLTEHINICFEKERMYIQAMDSSHISIFEIFIPHTWFDTYILEKDQNVTIGISSTILFKILNSRDKSQSIKMTYEDDGDTFSVYMTSENSLFNKNFEVPLIDLHNDIMEIPIIDYHAELSLPSSHFASIISQLQYFGDNLDFYCTEEKIQLFSTSQEQGKMAVEIKIDDLTSFAIEEDSNIKLSFSLKYLHTICMYNKIAKDIEIKIHRNYPLRIDYNFGDGAIMRFFLAPKAGDDDDDNYNNTNNDADD